MNLIIQLRDYNQFSPSERVVAEYVFNNIEKVLKMSARELGKITFTSASNVMRMCNKLNTTGFTDFKLQLAKEINIYQQQNISINAEFPIEEDDQIGDVTNKITQLYINAIKETQLLIESDTMQRVIDLIDQADCIDFYGSGASRLVANDAVYKFLRIGKNVRMFNEYDLQLVNAKVSTPSHVAFLVSYSGKTDEILTIAKTLVHQNVPIVSMTAIAENPLKALANEHLYVSSREAEIRLTAMASRTAMLYLFDIIFSAYCIKEFDKTSEMIKKTYINNKGEILDVRETEDRE